MHGLSEASLPVARRPGKVGAYENAILASQAANQVALGCESQSPAAAAEGVAGWGDHPEAPAPAGGSLDLVHTTGFAGLLGLGVHGEFGAEGL